MGSNYYTIASILLFATVSFVHGFVCPVDFCALVKCEGITESSCIAADQVLMPYAGVCGCCPACVKKINKGETCPGFLQLLGVPENSGCEAGTMCTKIGDSKFVCN